MTPTAQQDHREKQARTAGEEARRRLEERAKERGRVFLDQLAGSEGADDKAERTKTARGCSATSSCMV
jgi:hypothetical protein